MKRVMIPVVTGALYLSVQEKLTELLNENCERKELEEAVENVRTRHDKIEISLICLSKLIKYCIKRCDLKTAEEKLNEYNDNLRECTSTQLGVFEVMGQYLRCFMERSKGNYDESYKIAKDRVLHSCCYCGQHSCNENRKSS